MTLEKFKLLCWKNFTLQKRHPIAGLFEILFPIAIVALFTIARNKTEPDKTEQIFFPQVTPAKNCPSWETFGMSPSSNPALVKLVNKSFGNSSNATFFENAAALNDWLSSTNGTVAGIEFDDSSANSTKLPMHLKFSIRLPHDPTQNTWLTDQLFPLTYLKATRDSNNPIPSDPPYNKLCFLSVQNNIERAFIYAVSSKVPPQTFLRRFPYPSVIQDIFITVAGSLFPLLFVFCMIFSSKNIIKNVTSERESKLKETMKMMGLSSALHWTAWFTKCFIMMEISIIAIVLLMCTSIATDRDRLMFAHSNPFLIWLFFNLYIVAVITFCFLISVVFKKSSTAANVGTLLFFITVVPFSQFQDNFYSFHYFLKVVYCLLLNSGMGQGVKMMLIEEGNETGLRFTNLFSREPGVGFSIGEVMLVMLCTSIIQMLLTIYIEKVFPGDIGIPEPFYFPFIPCIKFLKTKFGYNTLQFDEDSMLQQRRISQSDYEDEPNLKAGIRINNLSKVFDNKAAVNNLSMNIFEGQITVLLGHNGAGKTTTMSMLTGMYPPSSGTAYIDGKDIRTEIDEARQSLGLCPQTNILFDELTVKEHIIFFARLKGVKGKREIAEEVLRYVNLLELSEKKNAQSKTLSGGQKRKLSIGIALCGNSKIVMCDEPTSGMDPSGRRALWDLLIAEKKGRTILLTTHHMDEADVLGDRIAIMSEGQLRAIGSSFFLKKKFGTGYKLICVKEPGCNTTRIFDTLKEFAPDVQLESDAQTEAIFIISESHLPIFQHVFKRLEDEATSLRVSSFGCSLTTLEEVFLKIGTAESCNVAPDDENSYGTLNSSSTTILFTDFVASHRVTGMQLVLYQIYAIIYKKFHYLRRNYRSIIYMAVFSVWMIVVLMSAPTFKFDSAPALDIKLSSYEESITVIQHISSAGNLTENFVKLVGANQAVQITRDMGAYMMERAVESLATVNRKYLIGVTINERGNVAWFNGEPYHTSPLTINTLNRASLKSLAGNDHDISVTNKPFEWIERSDDNHRVSHDIFGFVTPLLLFYMLLMYWPSVFIGFYIKERETRAKLLQYISGANRFTYWITSFVFDYAIYLVIICALLAGVSLYQRPNFNTAEELGTLLVLFACYGFSTLPLIFAFSYLFTKHSTGENMVALGGLVLAAFYGVFKLLLVSKKWHLLSKIIYWIFLMVGPFSLLDAFVTIGKASLDPTVKILSIDEHGMGRNLIMMVLGGFLFLGICLMKDYMLFEWVFYKFRSLTQKLPPLHEGADFDVSEEAARIENMTAAEIKAGNLVLKGLTKFYGNHLAVNQLHLAVGASECFGLLGINGAGKTSTFKMMTGDELISAGDAFIQGFSMKNQMQKVHQLIGYCPQFDALLDDLSGRETLKIFALLRGIPKSEMADITNKLAIDLGFQKHLDKNIKAFSGGNKRKLSTALALIGDPSLVFLDEPTTGMDPGAKRQLWNIINKTRNSGRSIVLTSHSMEECEALCTKLAIMVNGEFRCLGSTQHLKNKFSKGFILTIKTGLDDDASMNDIQGRVEQMFRSAVLKEKYMDMMTFHISSMNVGAGASKRDEEPMKWSVVFSMMAQLKDEVGITDYALAQTSLEQVFLFFTKSGLYQRDETQ